jgi:DnaK suppressor protein
MSPPELDISAARDRLKAERAALAALSHGSAGSRAPVELDQASVGRLSRVDAMQGQAMAMATEQRRSVAMRRIDQALARIDAGSYGECVVCGDPIAPERLAIDPAFLTCVACSDGKAR